MRIHTGVQSFLIAVIALLPVNSALCQQLAKDQQQPPPQAKKCQGLGCPIPGDEIPLAPTQTGQDRSATRDEELKGVTFRNVFTNLPGDQKAIWTSPFHIRTTDTAWLLPLAATSGVLIGSDQHSMARERSNANA